MSQEIKCTRSRYCQEKCIVHPKTGKQMLTCQKHWDISNKSRMKRKVDVAFENAVKRQKTFPDKSIIGEANSAFSSRKADSIFSDNFQNPGMICNDENTYSKTYVKTEKLNEHDTMITTIQTKIIRRSG
jgi:hypothetical protein